MGKVVAPPSPNYDESYESMFVRDSFVHQSVLIMH